MTIPPDEIKDFIRYDPDVGRFFWIVARGRKKAGEEAGCNQTGKTYRRVGFRGVVYQEHRLAWWFVHAEWPPEQVDHINNNAGDNRIANLRLANASENGCNRRGRNKLKGVTFHRGLGRYQAQIKKNGRNYYLGVFPTETEAHAAYCSAADRFHGDFARLA